jgi:hypothetical protein
LALLRLRQRTKNKCWKSAIASKLKSVETSDSMTSNQIIAKVKKFYDQNNIIGIVSI